MIWTVTLSTSTDHIQKHYLSPALSHVHLLFSETTGIFFSINPSPDHILLIKIIHSPENIQMFKTEEFAACHKGNGCYSFRNGTSLTTFTVHVCHVKLACSSISEIIVSNTHSIDCSELETLTESTTHLVQDCLKPTEKSLLALIFGLPIVTSQWISHLTTSLLKSPIAEIPDHHFFPKLAVDDRLWKFNWSPHPSRKCLFKNHLFIVLTESQFSKIHRIVTSAQGLVCYPDEISAHFEAVHTIYLVDFDLPTKHQNIPRIRHQDIGMAILMAPKPYLPNPRHIFMPLVIKPTPPRNLNPPTHPVPIPVSVQDPWEDLSLDETFTAMLRECTLDRELPPP